MFDLAQTICQITGAKSCGLGDVIQSLWSGYGVIQRVQLDLPDHPTAIVKHIDLSQARENRRGWSGDVSHNRKVRSYEIEKRFYETYATNCSPKFCRVPKLIGAFEKDDGAGYLLVLEDLDAAGFNVHKRQVSKSDLNACLHWLANFHATFMGSSPEGCLLYTSPSPRDKRQSRMPSSA